LYVYRYLFRIKRLNLSRCQTRLHGYRTLSRRRFLNLSSPNQNCTQHQQKQHNHRTHHHHHNVLIPTVTLTLHLANIVPLLCALVQSQCDFFLRILTRFDRRALRGLRQTPVESLLADADPEFILPR
jgi:hypothetical protein